jgi:alpha-N-arabinofuranosidase
MYRRYFGTIPVEISGAPEPLDIAATWTEDKKSLTISVVNPTYESYHLAFKVVGARLASGGDSWILTGPDDMAYNDPGKEPVVKFTEKPMKNISDNLEITPVSATIFKFKVR